MNSVQIFALLLLTYQSGYVVLLLLSLFRTPKKTLRQALSEYIKVHPHPCPPPKKSPDSIMIITEEEYNRLIKIKDTSFGIELSPKDLIEKYKKTFIGWN